MAKYERLVKLIAIGKMRDKLFDSRCQEFLTRLNAYGRCEVAILPVSPIAPASAIGIKRHVFVCLRYLERQKTAVY